MPGAVFASLFVMVLPFSLQAQAAIEQGPLPLIPDVTYHPEPADVEVEPFLTGLEIVWKLAFAPDGRMFFTERPGRIRTVSADGELDDEAWVSVEDRVYLAGESGLMGLALHPDFPDEPWVYVMYSVQGVEGGPYDRVSRFREENGRGGEEEILLDALPAPGARGNNRGGSLAFGPDDMLYVSVGENFERELAGNPEVPHGSVLRVTPEGHVPQDNPWPGNPVWAYGLRNVQGMAWQPETGHLFVADHGPSGEGDTRHFDRILVLEKGAHHGWPAVVGAPGRDEYVDPILVFEPASPPGDLVFFNGDLYMSILGFNPVGGHALLRVRFQDPAYPLRPTAQERWFNDEDGEAAYGRLRGMAPGPDGVLYVGTSNRDGRGVRRQGDDRILRIVPR